MGNLLAFDGGDEYHRAQTVPFLSIADLAGLALASTQAFDWAQRILLGAGPQLILRLARNLPVNSGRRIDEIATKECTQQGDLPLLWAHDWNGQYGVFDLVIYVSRQFSHMTRFYRHVGATRSMLDCHAGLVIFPMFDAAVRWALRPREQPRIKRARSIDDTVEEDDATAAKKPRLDA